MSAALIQKLAVVRRRTIAVDSLDGGCLIILSAMGGLLGIMLLDDWIELPWMVRAFFFAALVGWLGVLLIQRIGIPLWRSAG